MDILLHAANVLYLFSYSVRDILALRVLTVVAACCLIPYFIFRPEPLWAAVGWNLLFTAINFYRIVVLYRERRPVQFSKEENALYRKAFYAMSDRHFAKLLKVGQWKQTQSDTRLLESGSIPAEFVVLVQGAIEVKKNGSVVAKIQAGEFLGETALISEEPITTEVVATSGSHYFSWPTKKLKSLLHAEPALHAELQRVISRYLMRTLPRLASSAA